MHTVRTQICHFKCSSLKLSDIYFKSSYFLKEMYHLIWLRSSEVCFGGHFDMKFYDTNRLTSLEIPWLCHSAGEGYFITMSTSWQQIAADDLTRLHICIPFHSEINELIIRNAFYYWKNNKEAARLESSRKYLCFPDQDSCPYLQMS